MWVLSPPSTAPQLQANVPRALCLHICENFPTWHQTVSWVWLTLIASDLVQVTLFYLNLLGGPQVYLLFCCYVLTSLNKVVIIIITINQNLIIVIIISYLLQYVFATLISKTAKCFLFQRAPKLTKKHRVMESAVDWYYGKRCRLISWKAL